MKHIKYCIVWFVVFAISFLPIIATVAAQSSTDWFNGTVSQNLATVYYKANEDYSDRVQDTELNKINSVQYSWEAGWAEFTVTSTIIYLVENLHKYIQYVVYAWWVFAIIFLIINSLQLILASDKAGQMKKFKKNILLIVLWLGLLVWFYYVIDLFVSLANLFLG